MSVAKSRLVVAVDGGAATGKSEVCKALARELDLPYFNAGLIYRALTLACLERSVDLDVGAACAGVWDQLSVRVAFEDLGTVVLLGDTNVTANLRAGRVSNSVARVSKHPEVRERVTSFQRKVLAATEMGMVIDGRDVTSVVVPEADVKLILLASERVVAARGARRAGPDSATNDVERNRADAAVSDFSRPRPDAIAIRTDDLSLESVVAAAIKAVRSTVVTRGERIGGAWGEGAGGRDREQPSDADECSGQ